MGIASGREGRLAAQVVGAAVAVFIGLILVAGPYFRSFDEAKYVGIGYSMLAGHGPRTVFGVLFTPHSPLWATVVAAPDVWFGVDAFAWGQFLNAMAGVGVLLLVYAFGSKFRPIVGALAVVAYLASPYFQDLTRTARLDVPAAFLVLAYLLLAIEAVRLDSVPRTLGAGVLVAIAFLVKEIVLPIAPVPFLVGVLIGRPIPRIARLAGLVTGLAAILTAWWFVLVATSTHLVYRLGVSDRYLGPLYVGAAVLIVVAVAAPWIAERPFARSAAARIAGTIPSRIRPRARPLLAWGFAFAWFAAFVVFFDRSPELKGVGLVSVGQYAAYVDTWFQSAGVALIAVTALGVVAAFATRPSLRPESAMWFDAIVLALLCSAPLVMLVIAVGEPPRNYLVQIALIVVLAALGWLSAARVLARQARSRWLGVGFTVGGAAAVGYLSRLSGVIPTVVGAAIGAALGWLGAWRWRPSDWGPIDVPAASDADGAAAGRGPHDDRRTGRWRSLGRPTLQASIGPAGLLIAAFVVSTTALTVHAARTRQAYPGNAQAQAVEATAAWIGAHVPAGARIGFGSYLAYETAVSLPVRNQLFQIHQALAVVDPRAPLGLAIFGGPPVDDWIAVDTSRREREFYVFRASDFERAVIADRIAFYVYLTGIDTSVPALLATLRPEHGFTLLTSATFESINASGASIQAGMNVFAVDPSRVDFSGAPMVLSPAALDRLTALLAAEPTTAAQTAGGLVARAVTYPDPAAAGAFLDRLRPLTTP